MMTYPLAYLLIWSIPTSIRIYQAVTGNPAPFGIATVDKVENVILLPFPSSFLVSSSLHLYIAPNTITYVNIDRPALSFKALPMLLCTVSYRSFPGASYYTNCQLGINESTWRPWRWQCLCGRE